MSEANEAGDIVVFANFATGKYIDSSGDERSLMLVRKKDDGRDVENANSWYYCDRFPQMLLYQFPKVRP